MVFVTVSETYDLSTKPNKMSLIGIHTPKKDIIMKSYPGLLMNHKFIRIVKQDVTLACASMLPLDPSRVGFDDGDVAPQDLFNPILYKAVSNDSMSTLEARLHGLGYTSSDTTTIDGQSLIKSDEVTKLANDFNVYYSLLSDREGFKTAHPQQGLSMKGLVPYVFEKYYAVGQNANHPQSADGQNDRFPVEYNPSGSAGISTAVGYNYAMRGRAHPMPRFNTTYITQASGESGYSSMTPTGYMANGMGNGLPYNDQVQMPDVIPVYTAAIVMPPCKQTQIYYRMVVRTVLEFSEVRPITDITSFAQMDANYAPFVYASDYNDQSAQMTKSLGMVDAQEANLEKIMEGM